jgi:Flp pilus assembly protein TadD
MFLRWLLLALSVSLHAQAARDLRVRKVAPPLPDKRTRWAVVIGVSSYKYAPPQAQLRFAHRDAEDFASLLRSAEGGGFPASNIRLLTQEAATVGGIRAALHMWLPRSVGPNDIVYLFFAGHAVTEDSGDSYFVAHDSDPQNLHATGIPFQEVNDALTTKLRAASIVLFADACHAGGIGWAADPRAVPAAAQKSLEALGAADRSFLKLLASRPSEQSFEDVRWGGGHGIFTFSVLTALQGAGDRDRDGFVRASELIDYVSTTVPKQTETKQNPRVAGNFDAAMPMSSVPVEVRPAAGQQPGAAVLRITGPPNTAVYLDSEFRGSIRPTGDLVIETESGRRSLSLDLPGTAGPIDQSLQLRPGQNTLDVNPQNSAQAVMAKFRNMINTGQVLGAGGAYESLGTQTFQTPVQAAEAHAMVTGAMEDIAMECVSDYVQSTTNSLKRAMFLRSADAFQKLQKMRPADTPELEAKALFCHARAHIAANEFNQAIQALNRSLSIDPKFACSYNALGVALSRVGRMEESRKAFETAARLTPEWALPPLEIARQFIAEGDLRAAAPYLEKAAKLNPKATGIWWALARVNRLLGNRQDFLRAADATIAIDRNYAPIYTEIAQYYESVDPNPARAAQAYDSYLLLAPNFSDSVEIRKRVQTLRTSSAPQTKPAAPRQPPTLRREGENPPGNSKKKK